MKKNLTVKDITPAMKASVRAYLMSRVYAETMREAVDEIHHEILIECPIYGDKHTGRRGPGGEQILKSSDLYLCSDDDLCQEFYDEADYRLRKEGLKPSDMLKDHCPALVAEHLQMDAEHLVIESTAEMLGEEDFLPKVLCAGMDKYHKFIDLVTKMIVNMPGFALNIY